MNPSKDDPARLVADRDAASEFALSDQALEDMLGQIESQKETSGLGRLAEGSRRVRATVLAGILTALGAALVAFYGLRGDLSQAHTGLYVAALLVNTFCIFTLMFLMLRGYEDAPLGMLGKSMGLLALVLPAGLAATSACTMSEPLAQGVRLYSTLDCYIFAGVVGLMLGILARLFQRDAGWDWRRLGLAAGTGGSLAMLDLLLHCPNRDTDHLLLGHVGGYATVLVTMILAATLLDRLKTR
jgi:hypothetical protein